MDDKLLLEDDIIDLTDLLEEGSPPKKPQATVATKKRVTEPDSFDLGKEISMDYDVSIEEIEQDGTVLADEGAAGLDVKSRSETVKEEDMGDLLKEPLGGIESEIDKAMKDEPEEVSLTPKEEEVLLREGPMEEETALKEEEQAALMEEPPPTQEELAPPGEPVLQETPVPQEAPASFPEEPLAAPMPLAQQQVRNVQAEIPRVAPLVDIPTEAIQEAVITEFKKDMPVLLEGIVRPLVKEILEEVVSSTREALPGIVEKVIREEIDKLKKV